MVTVGVFVRARVAESAGVLTRLGSLDGVTAFELEEPGAIGVVLQGRDLDEAHAKLCDEVRAVDGVLVAWPIHTELGPRSGPEGVAAARAVSLAETPPTPEEGKVP